MIKYLELKPRYQWKVCEVFETNFICSQEKKISGRFLQYVKKIIIQYK